MSEDEIKRGDSIKRMVDKLALDLGEHVEAVQVLVSWQSDEGRTRCVKSGFGNWYARQAMATEFIQEEISEDAAERIAKKVNPPPDDEWKVNV